MHYVKVGIPTCTELGHELCALCESCYTQFFFGIVCSPDDEHNDARNVSS